MPAGWTATGLWNVTGACAVTPGCDGASWAYYGQAGTCTYATGTARNCGSLTAAAVALPASPQITLTYCSSLQTENFGTADRVRLYVNSTVVDTPSGAAANLPWATRTVHLAPYAGQTVTLRWEFDTIDGGNNAFHGWQVDRVRVSTLGTARTREFNLDTTAVMASCMNGPDVTTPPPGCDAEQFDTADVDRDGDVDLRDGAVRNSIVTVYNDATIESCGNAVGGRLLMERNNLEVRCNQIAAFSDRYLDVARGVIPPLPNVSPNTINVTITTDPDGDEGELFGPRSDEYGDPWTLQSLTLTQDSKLNLLHRPGLPQFGPGEAVYVRNLTLESGAVLNTGFTDFVYENLSLDLSARIVEHVPVLGFSLEIIAFENDCEYRIRVTEKELGGNAQTGDIRRLSAGAPSIPPVLSFAGGVMEMRTLLADKVSAKGQFARAGEDEVMVAFDYLFVEDQGEPGDPNDPNAARLEVFLSDNSTPGLNIVPVASLYQPASGRACPAARAARRGRARTWRMPAPVPASCATWPSIFRRASRGATATPTATGR